MRRTEIIVPVSIGEEGVSDGKAKKRFSHRSFDSHHITSHHTDGLRGDRLDGGQRPRQRPQGGWCG